MWQRIKYVWEEDMLQGELDTGMRMVYTLERADKLYGKCETVKTRVDRGKERTSVKLNIFLNGGPFYLQVNKLTEFVNDFKQNDEIEMHHIEDEWW